MNPIGYAAGIAGAILLVLALGVGLRVYGIWDTKLFGAAEENAKTSAFEGSKAYRDGVKRDLDELCLAWSSAKSPDEKAAVASLLRHRLPSDPPELVPACATTIASAQ